MKLVIVDTWSIVEGIEDVLLWCSSMCVTCILCAMIIISLLGVVYMKYHNNSLHNDITNLEQKSHISNKQYQVISTQRIQALGFESVETFVKNNIPCIA